MTKETTSSFFSQKHLGLQKYIWNTFRRIHLPHSAIDDLQHIDDLLSSAPSSIWTRPICLLIPKDPHFQSLSDTCKIALVGFNKPLNFQWTIAAKTLNIEDLHINIKEFIALFINTYLSFTTSTK